MVSSPHSSTTCPLFGRPVPSGGASGLGPFCSKRCKLTDLGQWFGGEYVVASECPLDFAE